MATDDVQLTFMPSRRPAACSGSRIWPMAFSSDGDAGSR